MERKTFEPSWLFINWKKDTNCIFMAKLDLQTGSERVSNSKSWSRVVTLVTERKLKLCKVSCSDSIAFQGMKNGIELPFLWPKETDPTSWPGLFLG